MLSLNATANSLVRGMRQASGRHAGSRGAVPSSLVRGTKPSRRVLALRGLVSGVTRADGVTLLALLVVLLFGELPTEVAGLVIVSCSCARSKCPDRDRHRGSHTVTATQLDKDRGTDRQRLDPERQMQSHLDTQTPRRHPDT